MSSDLQLFRILAVHLMLPTLYKMLSSLNVLLAFPKVTDFTCKLIVNVFSLIHNEITYSMGSK